MDRGFVGVRQTIGGLGFSEGRRGEDGHTIFGRRVS